MPRIELTTVIAAPVETVFDLARNIDAHAASQASHGEKAVAGRTSGLIGQGEEVTWEAVHFGLRQRLTSRIVEMQRPNHFRDSMVGGAFQHMDHDHIFESTANGTVMKDIFDYAAPLGLLGRLADIIFLKRHMRQLLEERNRTLKAMAEAKK
jgi:ligand-binding SRPBCC domain-containing protein